MASSKNPWRNMFSSTILQRGREYYKLGKAKKLSDEGDYFSAVVRGTRNYHVKIVLDYLTGRVKHMECDCPMGEQRIPCKHEAAMLYLMESEGVFEGMINMKGSESEDEDMEEDEPETRKVFNKESKALKESLSSIRELESKDTEELKENSSEHFYDKDNYSYFDPSNFIAQAAPSKKTMREVEKLLKKGEPGKGEVATGYLNRVGEEEVVGQFTLDSMPGVYPSWRASVLFGKDELISASCSLCYNSFSSKSKLGHDPCAHEMIAIMSATGAIRDGQYSQGDETNREAAQLIASFGSTKEKEDAKNLPSVMPKIHIEPLVTNRYSDYTVEFRIGNENTKLYKVMNIKEIYECLKRHETHKFGKKTEIFLSDELLDDTSKEWFNFIKTEQEDLDRAQRFLDGKNTGYYFHNPFPKINDAGSSFELWGKVLDDFFDTGLKNDETANIAGKNEYGKKVEIPLKFSQGKAHLSFDIHPVYDKKKKFIGIELTGKIPTFIMGDKFAYYFNEKALFRIDADEKKILTKLQNAVYGSDVKLVVGRANLTSFYTNVLPELEKVADISETDTDEIEKYLIPDPEYKFYFDAQGDLISGTARVNYDDRVFSLSEYEENPDGYDIDHYRNKESEKEALDEFKNYLPIYDPEFDVYYCHKSDEELFDLLDHGLGDLMRIGDVQVTDRFARMKVKKHFPVNVGVELKSDLLDLSINSDDLSEAELLDILFSYKKKKKFIRLKNGDFLKLDENDSIDALSQMMEEMHVTPKEFVKGHMHLPVYRALYLDRMLDGMSDVYEDRDSHFKSLVRSFKSVEDADYAVPKTIKATLRKYQKEGYRWLRTLDEWHFGGILADEMGLGKTLQTIALIEGCKGQGSAIVVCPASLVYNWGEELNKFAPDLKVQLIAGTKGERSKSIKDVDKYDVNVTSYDLLKRDIDQYEGKEFRFAIVDEAQNLKNAGTAAAKSVKILNAKSRFALTGTPIENRLSELWSIFDFVMPGYLYDYDTFRSDIELPASKDDKDAREQLSRMVAPFILRRKKDDVLKDLPDKIEEIRYAKMDKKQQELYDGEVVRMKTKLAMQSDNEFRRNRIEILAELMRLREICCDPDLYVENFKGQSAKTDMCLDLVQSLIDGGHRTLLFSQFTSMLDILKGRLDELKIPYFEITGATPKAKRMELVNEFNNGDVPVFLISLKAGGTGLNLIGADSVIHYDPWWNVAVEDQATDRAHRIGQTKTVTVYKLIVKGTIEENIIKMQESKKKLSDDIIGGESVASAALDRNELMELLG